MNRTLIFLLIPFLAFSCSSAGDLEPTSEETTEEIVDDGYIDPAELPESEEFEVDNPPKINTDSIAEIYAELEQHYLDHQGLLEDARSDFYHMRRETFDVYSSGSEDWYFNEDFDLVYYQMDLGAEGGYSEQALGRVMNNIPWLIFWEESDVDNPSKNMWKFDDNGNIIKKAGMKIDYYNNEAKSYFLPSDDYYKYDYKKHLKQANASAFTSGAVYSFEDSKMVESEYGGMESAGYRMKIDSVLFFELYK